MRLAFAGTPDFAARIFDQLLNDARLRHATWVGVLTQPSRPQGRGRRPEPSPVHRVAMRTGLPVQTPESLLLSSPEGPAACAWLADQTPDVLLVVAYGLLLPEQILQTPRYGCINVHTSLLPRWRGAAPIQRALAANDAQTGVCLMQMERGLDTGPVWVQSIIPIRYTDTLGSLSDRLEQESVRLLVDLLVEWPFGKRTPIPQSAQGVLYAHKITADDREIKFEASAPEVFGQIRALDPSPAARTRLHAVSIKCGGASLIMPTGQWGTAGEVVALPKANQGLYVACGEGLIMLNWLQQPGGKRLAAQEFCRGFQIVVGDKLGDRPMEGPENHV